MCKRSAATGNGDGDGDGDGDGYGDGNGNGNGDGNGKGNGTSAPPEGCKTVNARAHCSRMRYNTAINASHPEAT